MQQAPASPEPTDRFYAAVRLVVRFWLWFCFKPVDVRHPEHVPADGPVLLCINHPNNLIDSLVVAAALQRKVHFLAAAAMFRNRLAARFLRACGAIRVYRKEDDPHKMDPNADAFAACFRALERGRLVREVARIPRHAPIEVRLRGERRDQIVGAPDERNADAESALGPAGRGHGRRSPRLRLALVSPRLPGSLHDLDADIVWGLDEGHDGAGGRGPAAVFYEGGAHRFEPLDFSI